MSVHNTQRGAVTVDENQQPNNGGGGKAPPRLPLLGPDLDPHHLAQLAHGDGVNQTTTKASRLDLAPHSVDHTNQVLGSDVKLQFVLSPEALPDRGVA